MNTPSRKTFDKYAGEYGANLKEIARLQALAESTGKDIQDELRDADPDNAGSVEQKNKILSGLRLRAELIPGKIGQYGARNAFIDQSLRAECDAWRPLMAASAQAHYDTVLGKIQSAIEPFYRHAEVAFDRARETDVAKELWDGVIYLSMFPGMSEIKTGQTDELIAYGNMIWSKWETELARNGK